MILILKKWCFFNVTPWNVFFFKFHSAHCIGRLFTVVIWNFHNYWWYWCSDIFRSVIWHNVQFTPVFATLFALKYFFDRIYSVVAQYNIIMILLCLRFLLFREISWFLKTVAFFKNHDSATLKPVKNIFGNKVNRHH